MNAIYEQCNAVAKIPIVIRSPLIALRRVPALSFLFVAVAEAGPVPGLVAAATTLVVTAPTWHDWSKSGHAVTVKTVVYAWVGMLFLVGVGDTFALVSSPSSHSPTFSIAYRASSDHRVTLFAIPSHGRDSARSG